MEKTLNNQGKPSETEISVSKEESSFAAEKQCPDTAAAAKEKIAPPSPLKEEAEKKKKEEAEKKKKRAAAKAYRDKYFAYYDDVKTKVSEDW